jgi:rhodanese-related sulfurtransferase
MKVSKWTAALLIIASLMIIVPPAAFSDDAGIGEIVSQAAPKGPNAAIPPGHYGLIASYADNFLTEAFALGYRNISFGVVKNNLSNYFIVDTRQCADYCKGHLPGAVNIPYQFLAKPWNLALLPTDNSPIVALCYTGQTGSQATVILNLLGYNAYNLRFGMLAVAASTTVNFGSGNQTVNGYGYSPLVTCDAAVTCQ